MKRDSTSFFSSSTWATTFAILDMLFLLSLFVYLCKFCSSAKLSLDPSAVIPPNKVFLLIAGASRMVYLPTRLGNCWALNMSNGSSLSLLADSGVSYWPVASCNSFCKSWFFCSSSSFLCMTSIIFAYDLDIYSISFRKVSETDSLRSVAFLMTLMNQSLYGFKLSHP